MYLMVGNGLVAGCAIASKDHLFINFLPPLLNSLFFVLLLFEKVVKLLMSLFGEFVFLLVFDECKVAMLEVLGNDVSDKTGKVA